MSNGRGDAISAGLAASKAMGPAAYAEHRRRMRAQYEKSRRARIKHLTTASVSGKKTPARAVRASGKR